MGIRRTQDAEKRATGDRIKYIREQVLGMTQEEFANRFRGEFTRGALGNWERGQGIKLANLRLIAEKFDIPLHWLAVGVGEKPTVKDFKISKPDAKIEAKKEVKLLTKDVDVSYDAVDSGQSCGFSAGQIYRPRIAGALPELDVQVGTGQETIGDSYTMPGRNMAHHVSAEWLLSNEFVEHEARVDTNHSVIIPVVGDSMFPSYGSGDRVLVDLNQNELLQDAVYVISDGSSAPQIKRLQRIFRSNPERVRIISDNPVYSTTEHLLSEVEIIGRVAGVISRR